MAAGNGQRHRAGQGGHPNSAKGRLPGSGVSQHLLVTNAVPYLFDVDIRFAGHNDLILTVCANLVTTERAPATCSYDYSFGSVFADFVIRKDCLRTAVNKESRQSVTVDVVVQVLTAGVIDLR